MRSSRQSAKIAKMVTEIITRATVNIAEAV
jgi:hypothetical protein